MSDERSLTNKETGGLRNRRGRNIKFAKLRLGGAGPEHTLDFDIDGLPDRPLAKPPEWAPTRLPDCFIPLLHSGASISYHDDLVPSLLVPNACRRPFRRFNTIFVAGSMLHVQQLAQLDWAVVLWQPLLGHC